MSQYGAGPLLGAVWSPLSLIQYGGMDWAYPFFYARKQSEEDGRRLMASASLFAYFSVLVAWLGFLIYAISSNWLASYASVTEGELVFYVLGILPSALIYWLCYLLRFLNRSDSYIKISLLGRILPVVVVLPLLPYFNQENRLLISFAVGWLLSCLALGYALFEVRRVGYWPFRLSLFDLRITKEMLRYGLLLVPAGVAYALVVVSDRILIGYFLGTDDVAVHAIAMAIGSLGVMFVGWFGLAFDPHLSCWIASGNQANYLLKIQLLAPSLTVFFVVLSNLAAIWSAPLIGFVYPDGYAAAAPLVPLIIYAAALTALSRLGVATALIAQTPKFHSVLYGAALVLNVGVGLCLIPMLGVIGAVISTVVAEAAILVCWIYLGKFKLKNLPIKWRSSIFMLILGLIFNVVMNVKSNNSYSFLTLCIISVCVISIFAIIFRIIIGRDGKFMIVKHFRC